MVLIRAGGPFALGIALAVLAVLVSGVVADWFGLRCSERGCKEFLGVVATGLVLLPLVGLWALRMGRAVRNHTSARRSTRARTAPGRGNRL